MTKKNTEPRSGSERSGDVEDHGLSGGRRSILAEFFDYLMENKKWWLIPIILVILLFLVVLVLGGSPAASFIYALF